jgi:hypothetical protein
LKAAAMIAACGANNRNSDTTLSRSAGSEFNERPALGWERNGSICPNRAPCFEAL